MADWNFIIILIASIIVAVVIGIGMGALGWKIKEWILKKRAKEFLEGKRENVYKLDGERINLNKLKWKSPDGKIEGMEIPFRQNEKIIIKEEIKELEPFKPELPKEVFNYQEDFKRFKEANKNLEELKKKYEEGELTYQLLKERFEFYQNQDYYKRVLEK